MCARSATGSDSIRRVGRGFATATSPICISIALLLPALVQAETTARDESPTLIACLHQGRFRYSPKPRRCDFFTRFRYSPARGWSHEFRDVGALALRWRGWGSTRATARGHDGGGNPLTIVAYRRVHCGHRVAYYTVIEINRTRNGSTERLKLAKCNESRFPVAGNGSGAARRRALALQLQGGKSGFPRASLLTGRRRTLGIAQRRGVLGGNGRAGGSQEALRGGRSRSAGAAASHEDILISRLDNTLNRKLIAPSPYDRR